MSDKNQIKNSLPDPLAVWEDKLSDSYGLKVAKYIEREWFEGGARSSSSAYGTRSQWIRNKRRFVRGENDPGINQGFIEPTIKGEGRDGTDSTYLNLDLRTINLAAKFCNLVSNGIGEDNYRVVVNSVDPLTAKLKQEKETEYRNRMYAKPMYAKFKEELGVDIVPQGFIPRNEDEIDLFMQMKERPKIEIAEEIILDYVKKKNRWSDIEAKKNKDLVEIGISASKVFTDPKKGLKIKYTDPEDLVYSFVRENNFSDAHYFGEVDTITISELASEGVFSLEELRDIAKANFGINGRKQNEYARMGREDLLVQEIDLLRFCFKTNKTLVYKKSIKKKGRIKLTRKEGSYNPPERSDYKRIESSCNTWVEGCFVLGTDYIFSYKECGYIPRDENDEAMPPYIVRATDIYEDRLHSLLSDIEPMSDQAQRIHLKIQQLSSELKPDLIEIDIDTMADLGGGDDEKVKDWQSALELLTVKGILFTKRVNMGQDGIKDRAAARPMSNQQGSALGPLLNLWAHYYNLMREVTGINPVRDGTQPQNSLVGVNQMALLASNTATKHIVDAAKAFHVDVMTVLSSRITEVFRTKLNVDSLIEAVGIHNVEAVKSLENRPLHRFGFFVTLKLAQEEMSKLSEDLGIALSAGTIDVGDKIEVESVAEENPKYATKYLQYLKQKRYEERIRETQENTRAQTESNQIATQTAAQLEMKKVEFSAQIELQKEVQLSNIRVAEMQAKAEIEVLQRGDEFKYDVYLKKMDVFSNMNLNKFKEDEKTKRQDRGNSQNSKMIAQRKEPGSRPIDFENEFSL